MGGGFHSLTIGYCFSPSGIPGIPGLRLFATLYKKLKFPIKLELLRREFLHAGGVWKAGSRLTTSCSGVLEESGGEPTQPAASQGKPKTQAQALGHGLWPFPASSQLLGQAPQKDLFPLRRKRNLKARRALTTQIQKPLQESKKDCLIRLNSNKAFSHDTSTISKLETQITGVNYLQWTKGQSLLKKKKKSYRQIRERLGEKVVKIHV